MLMPYAYILEIKSGSEERSTKALESFALEVICPYETVVRRARGKRRKTESYDKPALPGYLVIRGSGVPWQSVFNVSTIFGALGFDGQPALISDEIVDHIRTLTIPAKDRQLFRPGQEVTVTSGPWMGGVAKVASLTDRRAKILVQCFGGWNSAEIDIDKLEAA